MLSILGSLFGYNAANVHLEENVGRAVEANKGRKEQIQRLVTVHTEYEKKIHALHGMLQRFDLPLANPVLIPTTDTPLPLNEITRKYLEISSLHKTLQKLKNGQLEDELNEMNKDTARHEALASVLEKEVDRLRESNDSKEQWNAKRQETALKMEELIEDAGSQ